MNHNTYRRKLTLDEREREDVCSLINQMYRWSDRWLFEFRDCVPCPNDRQRILRRMKARRDRDPSFRAADAFRELGVDPDASGRPLPAAGYG